MPPRWRRSPRGRDRRRRTRARGLQSWRTATLDGRRRSASHAVAMAEECPQTVSYVNPFAASLWSPSHRSAPSGTSLHEPIDGPSGGAEPRQGSVGRTPEPPASAIVRDLERRRESGPHSYPGVGHDSVTIPSYELNHVPKWAPWPLAGLSVQRPPGFGWSWGN